jgi:hypothetical protein
MPHAVEGRFDQCGLCRALNHETVDAELTGMATVRVRRERRTATMCLAPAIVTPGVLDSELGTTMLVHDAMRSNRGGREADECEYKSEFHCGIWTFRW